MCRLVIHIFKLDPEISLITVCIFKRSGLTKLWFGLIKIASFHNCTPVRNCYKDMKSKNMYVVLCEVHYFSGLEHFLKTPRVLMFIYVVINVLHILWFYIFNGVDCYLCLCAVSQLLLYSFSLRCAVSQLLLYSVSLRCAVSQLLLHHIAYHYKTINYERDWLKMTWKYVETSMSQRNVLKC
jgi:hypothetical protein